MGSKESRPKAHAPRKLSFWTFCTANGEITCTSFRDSTGTSSMHRGNSSPRWKSVSGTRRGFVTTLKSIHPTLKTTRQRWRSSCETSDMTARRSAPNILEGAGFSNALNASLRWLMLDCSEGIYHAKSDSLRPRRHVDGSDAIRRALCATVSTRFYGSLGVNHGSQYCYCGCGCRCAGLPSA